MKTATFIRNIENKPATQKLYHLSEPITKDSWGDEISANYVVVSAVNAFMSGPETYIFASDENGEIESWTELDGSFRGALDHDAALRSAGYEPCYSQ